MLTSANLSLKLIGVNFDARTGSKEHAMTDTTLPSEPFDPIPVPTGTVDWEVECAG